jgi:hypothetical protein
MGYDSGGEYPDEYVADKEWTAGELKGYIESLKQEVKNLKWDLNTEKQTNKILRDQMHKLGLPALGLYRVFWKSGGDSLAAIGMNSDGSRWLAPTNWVSPGQLEKHWDDIERLERIEPQEDD